MFYSFTGFSMTAKRFYFCQSFISASREEKTRNFILLISRNIYPIVSKIIVKLYAYFMMKLYKCATDIFNISSFGTNIILTPRLSKIC